MSNRRCIKCQGLGWAHYLGLSKS